MSRKLLLCGASILAILVAVGAADADTFSTPGRVSFTASLSGEYAFKVVGAAGGGFLNPGFDIHGGAGAEISGEVSLTAGEQLTLIVGGAGVSAGAGRIRGQRLRHGFRIRREIPQWRQWFRRRRRVREWRRGRRVFRGRGRRLQLRRPSWHRAFPQDKTRKASQ